MAKISKKINPLMAYKEKEGISWNQLSKRVDLSAQHLWNVAQHSPEDMKTIRLTTLVELQSKLGIDIISYIKE